MCFHHNWKCRRRCLIACFSYTPRCTCQSRHIICAPLPCRGPTLCDLCCTIMIYEYVYYVYTLALRCSSVKWMRSYCMRHVLLNAKQAVVIRTDWNSWAENWNPLWLWLIAIVIYPVLRAVDCLSIMREDVSYFLCNSPGILRFQSSAFWLKLRMKEACHYPNEHTNHSVRTLCNLLSEHFI